ncbi:spore germination protein [Paenibacillus oceani]|uniref:Spore germination protein n=1 Tax=Paenibacillus oceani TaxID=2772510 RepID=A0A927C4G3_9BACL|nr:spore germination protein [Paenibacillus oceani]MBD2861163.1 spore germination protein [Paenibacillus oceani]
MGDATAFADRIVELFALCGDVKIDTLELPGAGDGRHTAVQLVYCESLCDVYHLNRLVIPSLFDLFRSRPIPDFIELERHVKLRIVRVDDPSDEEAIVRRVFRGELLLWFESFGALCTIDISDIPARNTEEPNTEVSIKGPKDGFTEELTLNLGLIRKRLKSNKLAADYYRFGSETETQVALLYMNNRINSDVLSEIRSKLGGLNLPELISSTQLEETLSGFSLFPQFAYTGRPDYAVNSLLHGRFVLLVEGSPTASIAPVTLTYIMNVSEDAHTANLFVTFTRLMRMLGLLFSLFLPGFWIALMSYHQDQIPFSLLATLVISRQGVPLPVPLEAFVMLLLFELFREAGMRLPSAFGQTLSVVGGLIIGQAAISAGITAPGTIVIVAISVMATFTLVNQQIVGMVSILRGVILLVSGLLGLFGFLFCLLAMALYLVNLKSFGVYYMEPLAPPDARDIWKVLFRFPWGKRISIPASLRKKKRGEGGGNPV